MVMQIKLIVVVVIVVVVTTLGSNLNATKSSHDIFFLQFTFYFSFADLEHEIWATITVS